jgi:hypothetical protein
MDLDVLQDDVPYPFQVVVEELMSQESRTNSLTSDAFGMVDNVLGEASVAFAHRNLTKDAAIAELDNLEYYEEVRGTEREMSIRPPRWVKLYTVLNLCRLGFTSMLL